MREMKCAELVLDFDLYPRQQIDSQHVSEMIEADKAGVEFEPVVVDKKSKRITDGFHRHRKQVRMHGPDATIMAIEKDYKTDADMFLDAMRYNANHGRALATYDRAHAILLAGRLGIDDKGVADALGMTMERVATLRVDRHAKAGNGKLGRSVAIKRTIGHMAGKKLTSGQVAVNKKLGGMNQLFYVRQLLMLFEEDLIDRENEELMKELKVLREKLSESL